MPSELAEELRALMLAQGATEQEIANAEEELRIAEYRFRTWDGRLERAEQ